MLHRASRLRGALVRGTDGDIGTVTRLYFDDRRWTISHLGVDSDQAPSHGSVLLSPSSIQPHWNVAELPATLSQNDIRRPDAGAEADVPETLDPNERSTEDVTGFHIEATDGEIGHVDDFLIDEDSWRIRYLVVDTSNWIGGKWVAIAPGVLRNIDWEHGKLEVDITREGVKQSPLMESMPVPSAETMPPFILI
jgi:hypothetical protein